MTRHEQFPPFFVRLPAAGVPLRAPRVFTHTHQEEPRMPDLSRRHSLRLLTICSALALAGCGSGDYHAAPEVITAPSGPAVPAGANVVLQWNAANIDAIRVTKPGPPMTARALAIVSTAMYDAWAAYDPQAIGTRLGAELRRPSAEHTAGNKAKAISHAAYEALLDLYPSQAAAFEKQMRAMGYDPTLRSTDRSTPEGVGHLAALALLSYRHLDGANQLGDLTAPDASGKPVPYADYTSYAPLNAPLAPAVATALNAFAHPESWQPLSYVNGDGVAVTPKYIAPHWGKVIPFAMTRSDQFRPAVPKTFGSAAYVAQVQEVMDLTAGLDDRSKSIAEYWADGPNSELPPGHWHLFARQVSERDKHTLDDDAKMFFALSNAVFDAGIATWEAKRYYDTSRPITAVRYLFNGKTIRGWGGPGKNNVEMDGASWIPFQPTTFPTPPFSEYTSGHSAFSGAAAEVLKRYTGSDAFSASVTVPAHSLKAEPASPANPVVLSWTSFTEAADEAGMSRLYGGIHFHDADQSGRLIGRQTGTQAYLKAQAFWRGEARP